MTAHALKRISVLTSVALLSACMTPVAKLTYSMAPKDGVSGQGFPFVIPRTVVRVTPTDKGGVSFATIPLNVDLSGKSQLPAFVLTDSSDSGWSLTPTTVSAVTYADDLVISGIGTVVTDNRGAVIDTIVTAVALAGAFAAGSSCVSSIQRPFTIEYDPAKAPAHTVPGSACWGYKIEPLPFNPISTKPVQVAQLPIGSSVPWFPVASCKSYRVQVYQCQNTSCSALSQTSAPYETTLALSDGTTYQQVPLPLKGKITLHPDFCGADVTNEGTGTSNWSLLKQLIGDVKAEKK